MARQVQFQLMVFSQWILQFCYCCLAWLYGWTNTWLLNKYIDIHAHSALPFLLLLLIVGGGKGSLVVSDEDFLLTGVLFFFTVDFLVWVKLSSSCSLSCSLVESSPGSFKLFSILWRWPLPISDDLVKIGKPFSARGTFSLASSYESNKNKFDQ